MSIEIIDILKPKNGLSFKLVDAIDIAVSGYSSLADAVSHFATTAMIEAINTALSGKQDKLTTEQLTAVNSGITAQLVTQIGTNATAIAGKASQSDLTLATTNLQAQIDNIVSGSTADSEVINARVGADGESYNTLKARLDAEESKNTTAISTLTSSLYRTVGQNVDVSTLDIVSGSFVRDDTGKSSSNEDYSYVFTYINVENISYIEYSRIQVVSGQTHAGIAFYDSDYEYISGEARLEGAEVAYVSSTVNVPTGAKYVRLSLRNELTGFFVRLYHVENKCDKNTSDIATIDTQIDNINTELTKYGNDLYDVNTATLGEEDCNVVEGKFCNYDSTQVSTNEDYSYARFVNLKGYDVITYSRIQVVSGQTHCGIQFRSGDTYVGGQQRLEGAEVAYVTTTIPIPEGATSAHIPIRNDLAGWSITLTKIRNKFNNTTVTVGSKNISNAALRASKERTFADGTAPYAEWYLVEDVTTNEFFKTTDFKTFKYLFTAHLDNTNFYKYGITQNDDVIAVFRTESLDDVTTHTDDVRKNPYVFLASEDYAIQHLVDFGNSKKPSGWLSSVGFRVLPSGTVIFDEYTRPSVATANVWRLTGDITDPTNWEIVKTFSLSGDTSEGFKHCHSVMHDHYTDIVYFTTGDDNDGAMVWYSTDDGLTWTQITIADPNYNEKYFRILNYTFLEDYVYWSTDTGKSEYHYIFKAPRTQAGVIDYANVVDLVHLTQPIGNYATYGTSYLPELDLLVLLERCDSNTATTAPVRAYSISGNEVITLGNISTPDGNGQYLGFRTEHTEYYPIDGKIKFGFGQAFNYGDYRNTIKGFGNQAKSESIQKNVNNLYLQPYKVGNSYKMRLGVLV